MTSIQSLPEDLLFAIFQTIQQQEARSAQSLSHCRSWLRHLTLLSLVSKSWRETILQHGVLWTRIPVDATRDDSLEGVSTMLQRSKGAELTLSVHLSANSRVVKRTNDLVKAIVDQHSRVRSLYLTADPRSIFEIGAKPSGPTADRVTTADNPPIPNYSQRFSSLLKGLRTLSLSLPSPTVSISISGLLHVIEASPGLELLRLTSIAVVEGDRPFACIVRASSLQKFCLHDCSSAVILPHVVVSKKAVIVITMSGRRIGGQREASSVDGHILHALPYSLSSIRTSEDAKRLVLEEDEEKGTFGLGLSPFRSRSPSVVVRNRPPSIKTFIYRSLNAIANHPYFDTVESFTLFYSSRVPACWSTILGSFDLLLELNASSHHGAEILCALMHTIPNRPILCPSLRRIRLFHRRPGTRCLYPDSHLLTTFHQFRAEARCSSVRITVDYPNGERTSRRLF